KPQTVKKSTEDLEQTHAEFVVDFWRDFAVYQPSDILNVHETAINFEHNRAPVITIAVHWNEVFLILQFSGFRAARAD
ncbi:hypothetical protein L914_16726, partial [Phytophthora nicotianae]